MKPKPLLSVCLRTYNNQDFILDALNGIFMQKVNFDLELIYSDDCSNDNTFEIATRHLKECNNFLNLQLVKQNQNLGMIDNLLFLLQKSSGKYIAMCDGDDYWSDPNKLQMQVDFLETNPEYEVCFTNVCTIEENGNIIKEKLIKDGRRNDYEMKHLPTWVPVSTKVFRNRDFGSLNRNVPGDDMYMLLYQSKFGKIKFINKVTAAYRYQSAGMYTSLNMANKKDYVLQTHIECMALVPKELYPKYHKLIIKKFVELRYLDSTLYNNRVKDFVKYIRNNTFKFPLFSRFKINFILLLLSLGLVVRIESGKGLLLKIINRLF